MLIQPLMFSVIAASWLPWFTQEEEPKEPVVPIEEAVVLIEEPPPPPEPPAPVLFPDPLPFHPTLDVSGLGMTYSASCGGCHNTAFTQWDTSSHHTGAHSSQWLDSIKAFGDGTLCTSCHKPFEVQHEELTTEVIEGDVSRPVMEANPNWNPNWQTESVGCAACHVREGVVVGSKTTDSPHPVRNSDTIGTSEACQSCHQFQLPDEDVPIYNTYQEWKNSAYSNAGIQCQSCHMTTGSVIGSGLRNHNMKLTAAQGLTLTVQTPSLILRRNQEIPFSIVVHNTGVGHSWPGSSPFIEKTLIVRIIDDNGKTVLKDIRHPIGQHRDEKKTGPSIAVGNQHSFESGFSLSNRLRESYAMLHVVYQKGDEEELLYRVRVEVR